MRFFTLISLLIIVQPSMAELRFTGAPTGYSKIYNYNPNNLAAGIEIAGGLGGDCASSSATCNSCTGNWIADGTVCNKERITPSTELTFTFLSTDKAGIPRMVSVVTTGNGTAVSGTQPTISVPANSATSLRATWANICAAFVDGTNGCQDMREDQSFRVGIDKDGDSQLSTGDDFITVNIKVRDPQVDPLVVPNFATVFNPADLDPATSLCATVGAICNFSLERGDQKATIQDLSFGTSGLDTNYKQIAFFCAVQDTSGLINFSSINRECTNPVDISGANALVEDTITGLNNDVEHFFRAAIIDEAGNYGLFFRGDNDPTVCASTGLPSCHSVVPEEVVGLFRDTNCFVATAAFGSPMEKQVKTLRRFRDQVLSKSSFGQMFVKLYYQVSPPMARWIAQSPLRRSVTRGALTPVIFSVALAMDHPIWFGLILISLVSALIIWLRRSRETLT